MQANRSPAATPGRDLFDEALALFQQGKTDELIDRYYRLDAVLITPGRTVKEHEALKTHFRALVRMLGKFELLSLDSFTESDDAILVEKTIRTAVGEAKVYDVFVFVELKITHHFTGVR